MEKKSSKQSEGLGINLWNKYSTDIFFRTTIHIILVQVVLTIIAIIGLWFGMKYLVQETSQTLINTFTLMLQGDHLTSADVTENLEQVRIEQYWQITVITAAVILSFGFVMLYIALTPTRLSLDRKKRFISNISHELRTPLAVMRTNTDVSLLDKEIPTKVRERLQRNLIEFDRISEIMNNLLGLSNLMQDQHFHFSDVDLSVVARQALDSLNETIDRKDITTQINTYSHQKVRGNASALEQVVFNLVKNAITHIKTEGVIKIEIYASTDKKYINLSVSDTGSGIARKDLFHIFEPFYRAKSSKKFEGGQGLGLTIVNEIVQMHRGKIKIQSAVGRGTVVTVSIKASGQIEDTKKPKDPNDMEEISLDFSRRILQ